MLRILLILSFFISSSAFAGKSRRRECLPLLQQQQPHYIDMDRQRQYSGGRSAFQEPRDDGANAYDSYDSGVDGSGERPVEDNY